MAQHPSHLGLAPALPAKEIALGQLDIPVAELIPGKVIQALGGQHQVAAFQLLGHLLDGLIRPGQNPLVSAA